MVSSNGREGRSTSPSTSRRAFLGSIGAVGSLALIGRGTSEPAESIEVRFWRTERVASSSNTAVRIADYVEHALDLPFWSVEVTDGGVVSTRIEHGARVTSRGEWPAHLLAGRLRRGGIEPAADVNLLVTDGRMDEPPTGYGFPRVASVGGGSYLADVAPVAEQSGPVPLTRPNFVAQVVIHEVGHALGLDHDRGTAVRENGAIVTSPMLSAYAWDRSYDHDGAGCDATLPDPGGLERRLTFSFSDCARRSLREYSGRLVG